MFGLKLTPDDFNAAEAERDGPLTGLVVGTKVATRIGWRCVDSLTAGDEVLTFDSGFQPITRIARSRLWTDSAPCPSHLRPLRVPAGTLGNRSNMTLLPEQMVMIESDTAEEVFGDPFTLMPAAALIGFRGIEQITPREDISIVTICFAEDQVVFGNIGALFFCPKAICGEVRKDKFDTEMDGPYVPMSLQQAESLAAMIEADEAREEFPSEV